MKLDDLNKENVFKVPENYFEKFPDRLKQRIKEESEEKKPASRTVSFNMRLAIAASISIILVVALYLFIPENQSPEQILADVPSEDLISYLVESEISTEEMLESIDINLISGENIIEESIFFPEDQLEEETIEQMIDEYELEMQIL